MDTPTPHFSMKDYFEAGWLLCHKAFVVCHKTQLAATLILSTAIVQQSFSVDEQKTRSCYIETQVWRHTRFLLCHT